MLQFKKYYDMMIRVSQKLEFSQFCYKLAQICILVKKSGCKTIFEIQRHLTP